MLESFGLQCRRHAVRGPAWDGITPASNRRPASWVRMFQGRFKAILVQKEAYLNAG